MSPGQDSRTSFAVTFQGGTTDTKDRLTSVEVQFDWSFVLAELENPEDEMLKGHLKQTVIPLSRIATIIDDKGFSLLHHAVLKGIPGKVAVIIDLFKSAM